MSKTPLLVSAFFLLTGCASTTPPLDSTQQCAPFPKPDQRLMVVPAEFELMVAADDKEALQTATSNNLIAKDSRDRLVELQKWLKEVLDGHQ